MASLARPVSRRPEVTAPVVGSFRAAGQRPGGNSCVYHNIPTNSKLRRNRSSTHAGCAAAAREAEAAGQRRSPQVVCEEIASCYKVVERMGKGVVYLGSARTPEEHPHFQMAKSLSRDVSVLLGGATTWSGMGAGMMEAANQGALAASNPAAGFKIYREGGKWVGLDGSWEHPYLPAEAYVTCEFFSARKHGLAEAATRTSEKDKTAIVILPGGTGTLDEVFELVVLMQLDKLGTAYPVPVLLMNYDGFYDNLLGFFMDAVDYGAIGQEELSSLLTVCNSNEEALRHLADFYALGS